MGEKGCLRRKGVFGGKKRCLGEEKGCWGIMRVFGGAIGLF